MITESFIFKLIFACLLGGIIGYERDIHGRAAGLRTHILVSMGSALFMLISIYVYEKYSTMSVNSVLSIDPARIAAQIITGIGFLGAGVIINSGLDIRGLTTAGCIWVSAGIGMAVGIGYYSVAIISTLLSVFALIVMSKFEMLYERDSFRQLKVIVADNENIIKNIMEIINDNKIHIRYFEFMKNTEQKIIELSFILRIHHKGITDSISFNLVKNIEDKIENIKSITWERVK